MKCDAADTAVVVLRASVTGNGTVEHLVEIFSATNLGGIPVFVSPHPRRNDTGRPKHTQHPRGSGTARRMNREQPKEMTA